MVASNTDGLTSSIEVTSSCDKTYTCSVKDSGNSGSSVVAHLDVFGMEFHTLFINSQYR